ncbi:hypothetical protein GE115_11490 [Agromyces sp. CFH 90414]|uniref:Uncharacterized protein n=1 Tax=Agromyces agglutinans TaxID=2662258 RepID=A0A6I2FF12_9MICO|nr:hypothetical protein [Agromyces agglutinans]MRG60483.1 hypothetical protein [Agromyces agglutinans]
MTIGTTDLTARYVLEASRSLPRRQGREFARDLDERIRDEIDARLASGASTPESAEFDALAALGDPSRVAARYADRPPMLIGPRWYASWKRVLIITEWSTVPAVTGAYLLAQFIEGEVDPGMIGRTWFVLLTVGIYLAFWMTVVFAVIDRYSPEPGEENAVAWSPANLRDPAIPSRTDRRVRLISTLAWLAVLLAVVLWLQFGPSRWGHLDGILPVLDPALWSFWLPYFLVLAALEAAMAVWVYRAGFTWPWAAANIVLALAWAVPAVWLIVTGAMFAPGFVELFEANLDADGQQVLPILLIAGIVAGALADAILGVVRAARTGRRESLGLGRATSAAS